MVKAFLVLLVQKFMSIVIAKVSLYGEFPTLKDSSFLLLLGIHFLTFTLFHTHTGEEVMDKINKSELRIVIQETFKGYGKGLNLIKLVHKGMKLHTNVPYFILVLMIRGSASAMFKAWCVSLIEKKPIRVSKAKSNFLFIAIPSIILYLVQLLIRTYIQSLSNKDKYEMEHLMLRFFLSSKLEQMILHFFVTFMVISRCMRTIKRVFEEMQKRKAPKKRLRDRSHSIVSTLNNNDNLIVD